MKAADSDGTSKASSRFSVVSKIRIVALVLAAILIVIVVSKNWEKVSIDLLVMESTLPMAVLLILTFLFGISVGVLLAFLRPWKGKR